MNPLSPKARTIRSMFSSIAGSYDRLNHLLSFRLDCLWRKAVVRECLGLAKRNEAAVRRALDVCCGTGDLTLEFAKRLPRGASVAGLDFSEEMLRLAQAKARHPLPCPSPSGREREERQPEGCALNGNAESRQPEGCTPNGGEGQPEGCTLNGGAGRGRPEGCTPSKTRVPALFSCGDALALPFRDQSFDIASVAFGLRNFVDRPAGLREMARVTRKGGVVAVLEFSQPRLWLRPLYSLYLRLWLPVVGRLISGSTAYRYLADTVEAFASPEEVADWMRAAGLRDVRYKRFSQGIVVLHTGRVP